MLTGPKPKHGHAKVKGDAPPEGEEMISTDVIQRIVMIARAVWNAVSQGREDEYGRRHLDYDTVAQMAKDPGNIAKWAQQEKGTDPKFSNVSGITGFHPSKWALRIIVNSMVKQGYLSSDRKRAKGKRQEHLSATAQIPDSPEELAQDIVPEIEDIIEDQPTEEPGGWLDKMKANLGI